MTFLIPPNNLGSSKAGLLWGRRWLRTTLAVLFALAVLWLFGWGKPVVQVVVELQSHAGADGQMFYARSGQGYAPERSVTFTIIPDGRWHTYRIGIPEIRGLERIRVDPGSASGVVDIRRVAVEATGNSIELVGHQLSVALEVTNDLGAEVGGTADLRFMASAPDPFVGFKLPRAIGISPLGQLARWLVAIVASATLWLLLAELAWPRLSRRLAPHVKVSNSLRQAAFSLRSPNILLVPMTFAVIWALSAFLKLGCTANACMSERSLGYGALLTLAMLSLAIVGAGIVVALNSYKPISARPALFLWILVGQAGLMVYIYLRSLIASVLPLPVTRIEILLIAVVVLIYVRTKSNIFERMFDSPRAVRWVIIQLSTLAALSIWIADRELPRLVMLSSDPEIHAFFAQQVARLGAVPRSAEGWRNGVFNYPAGSAVLTYVWASLSWLDVRNTLAAQPLVQCALSALVMVEVVSFSTRDVLARLVLIATVLGVTYAGFLFPIYEQYSHMEGTGRQMSGAMFALFSVLLLAHRRIGVASVWMAASLMAVVLFCLGVLNPVNVMVPSALAGVFVVYCVLTQRSITPVVLVPPVAASLMLLDPYYSALIFHGSSVAVEKVGLASSLRSMSSQEVVHVWAASISNISELWHLIVIFPVAGPLPSFIIMLLPLSALLVVLMTRYKRIATGLVFAALLIVVLWLMAGLFTSLRGDARFYLLAPYFEFSIVQNKALLLTFLSALVVALVHVRYRQVLRTSMAAAAMVLTVAAVVRPIQQLWLEPRYSDCGPLGCPTQSDLDVLQDIKKDKNFRESSKKGIILVINSINQMGPEKWLFPVGGARLLAQEINVPLAFYYYHGDQDYTTADYEQHVCHTLDRAWLKSNHIRYVFLPANRSAACVDSIEALPKTEHIVASSGNSYLLEIN